MRDMVLAAAQGAVHPGVHNIKGQRRMHTDGGMQGGRRIPGFVAHTRHVFSNPACALQGQGLAVDRDDVAVVVQSGHAHFNALQ